MFGVRIISGWHKVWDSLLSSEKWETLALVRSFFEYSLLLSLKVLTTDSPGAKQLSTSDIYLFRALFM